MMLLTVADVMLRAVFNMPIRGVYELVELLLAGTFFFALPGGVPARREHRGRRRSTISRRDGCLRSSASRAASRSLLLAVMAWQGWLAAADTFAFNDVTADLGLPRLLHWIALCSVRGHRRAACRCAARMGWCAGTAGR